MNDVKMVLFDYGGTLCYEPDPSPMTGNAAIFPYISENPDNVTPEEFSSYLIRLFDEIRALRGEFIEIHEHFFLRYVLEHFNMKLTIPIEEAEWMICNGISSAKMTPGADKMLAQLREKGIRTGVISNLCWSGNAMKKRLDLIFPEHKFDFIMTSSEYIFRKPEPHIFNLAVRKTGLSPENIAYCGNDVEVDVMGSHNAGLHPVWYDDRSVPSRFYEKNDSFDIPFHHSRIKIWSELTAALGLE